MENKIQAIIDKQRAYFNSGATRTLDFRIEQLRKLRSAILINEKALLDALQKDLNKAHMEGYSTEVGIILAEINHALKNINKWMQKHKTKGTLGIPGALCYTQPEPLGIVLIISPWNYPLNLAFMPLIGAMAAGNCAVLKPSELAPHCSAVTAQLVQDTFSPEYITVVEGEAETATVLLQQRFDYIFFTGSPDVGRVVMQAAAKHLTPVTLELGGKSPCIVDKSADLTTAARRICFGKFTNAGQTCIAPDYLLAHQDIKEDLVKKIVGSIESFYGSDPQKSPDYGRIINTSHFMRLASLVNNGQVVYGGQSDAGERYIAPTILDNVSWNDPVMQEEIFGPILPIIEYSHLDEAIQLVNQRPKPLALYVFTKDKVVEQRVLAEISCGGACINDTLSHIVPHSLPFGGVGESGMGSYHGQSSFETFSHIKSVLKTPLWLDIKSKYPPYTGSLDRLKRLMKFV